MGKEGVPIQIVTDSTADLPQQLSEAHGIEIIPTIVTFGEETFRDRIDIGVAEFLNKLQQEDALFPTTAAPSLATYLEVYEKHKGKILSVHVGEGFSGVLNTAIAAANEIGQERISTYDSGTVSLGLGFLAIEAAQLSSKGVSMDKIEARLDDMKSRLTVMAALNTLEFLKKGGRASGFQVTLGSLLQIKPILEVTHNRIAELEKLRTRKRALNRLVELTQDLAPLERVGVMHADAEKQAIEVADRISDFYTGEIILTEIGPVVSSHAGPGAVGVCAVSQRQE